MVGYAGGVRGHGVGYPNFPASTWQRHKSLEQRHLALLHHASKSPSGTSVTGPSVARPNYRGRAHSQCYLHHLTSSPRPRRQRRPRVRGLMGKLLGGRGMLPIRLGRVVQRAVRRDVGLRRGGGQRGGQGLRSGGFRSSLDVLGLGSRPG